MTSKFGNSNSIFVIHPYKRDGIWAFDDAQKGLLREAFVSGADDLLELAATRVGIPSTDFHRGITVLFSASAFPGAQVRVKRTREELGGNWYTAPTSSSRGGSARRCSGTSRRHPTRSTSGQAAEIVEFPGGWQARPGISTDNLEREEAAMNETRQDETIGRDNPDGGLGR